MTTNDVHSLRSRFRATALGVLLGAMAGAASANPQGAQVVHGSAVVTMPDAATLEVTNTPGAIIHWQSFNIGATETTRFIQQSAQSAVLNRDFSGNPSQIFGNLLSNGQVFLVNRNGVLFGRNSSVDTAGLVASTLDIQDADFIAGRMHFSGDVNAGAVVNEGFIKTSSEGDVILVAPRVENSGIIETSGGDLLLAAGQSVTITSLDNDYMSFEIQAPTHEVLNLGQLLARGGAARIFAGSIKNSGTIAADSVGVDAAGVVELRASNRVDLEVDSVVSASAVAAAPETPADANAEPVPAPVVTGAGGRIVVSAPTVTIAGAVRADGGTGGTVRVAGSERVTETERAVLSARGASGGGGVVEVQSDGMLASSGIHDASGVRGGTVRLLGDEVQLTGALADARGDEGGGTVRVGGGMRGGEDLQAARKTTVDRLTRLRADAIDSGDGGTVAVWSSDTTQFTGVITARGGTHGGDGGEAEVSGSKLQFGGTVELTAENGQAGTLLLDPKFITIAPGSLLQTTRFADPNPSAGAGFGSDFDCFAGGNFSGCGGSADRILFYDPLDDLVGTDSGAVYLFDLTTGGLLSTLTGGAGGDRVGSGGIFQQLAPGVVLLSNPSFNGNGGAFTPFNMSTGLSGTVSATNSIIGAPGAFITSGSRNTFTLPGMTILTSNNAGRGAVTVLNSSSFTFATTGGFGVIDDTNSLVGNAATDFVGNGGLVNLSSGVNYIRSSSFNSNGGALTPITASSIPVGVVGAANSIIGAPNENLANGGFDIDRFTVGGNVGLIFTDNFGGVANRFGAVTAIDLTTGHLKVGGPFGQIGPTNSLVGTNVNDRVGNGGVIFAASGYVYSPNWNSDAGALTYFSPTNLPVGPVSATNSIIGNPGDNIGNFGIDTFTLPGHTLLLSPNWGGGLGAVTVLSNATGQFDTTAAFGLVDATNSLVGSAIGDAIGNGGIIDLGGGKLFVHSPSWNSNAGALTFYHSAIAYPIGPIDNTNSIFGNPGDNLGSNDIDTFSISGKTILLSPNAFMNAGAVTVLDNATGQFAVGAGFGAISSSNSLVGQNSGDAIGNSVIYADSGSVLVQSTSVNSNGGAITFIDSSTIPVGLLNPTSASTLNTIMGNAGDGIGANGIQRFNMFSSLMPGKVMVFSSGAGAGAGAITFLDNATGQFAVGGGFGLVSSANSLVGTPGSTEGVGNNSFINLFNGTMLVHTPAFNSNAGAITYFSSSSIPFGVIGGPNSNSITGAGANDRLGNGGINLFDLSGQILVLSSNALSDSGAVTVLDYNTGQFAAGCGTPPCGYGAITGGGPTPNSLVGNPGDRVGSGDRVFLNSGNLLIISPLANAGGGALTLIGSGTSPVGIVDSSNSIVASSGENWLQSVGYDESALPGKVVVRSNNFGPGGTNVGAVTVLDDSTGQFAVGGGFGAVGPANTLFGVNANDRIGSSGLRFLPSGAFLIDSPSFNSGAGAFTFLSSSVIPVGNVDATNSIFGAAPGDAIGSAGVLNSFSTDITGQVLILSPNFNGGTGGITAISDTTGQFVVGGGFGAIGVTNSLIGDAVGDNLGSGGFLFTGSGFVESPNWNGNAGAWTYYSASSTPVGTLTAGAAAGLNTIFGNPGDRIGRNAFGSRFFDSFSLAGKVVLRSPVFGGGVSAVTILDAATGQFLTGGGFGLVSNGNSLVGTTNGDDLGSAGVRADGIMGIVGGGRFAVYSPSWDLPPNPVTGAPAVANVGAITYGTLATGLTGTVSATNSLVGSFLNDQIGQFGAFNFQSLGTGSAYYLNQAWNTNAGALTLYSAGNAPVGAISAANSLVGSTGGANADRVANAQFRFLFTDTVLMFVPTWNNAGAANAGAVVMGNRAGVVGTVGPANALVGTAANDRVGTEFGSPALTTVGDATNGFLTLLRSPAWMSNAGAVTPLSATNLPVGPITSTNSFVGATAGDGIGASGSIINLQNTGRFAINAPNWDNGTVQNVGAFTLASVATGIVGTPSSTVSLVGTSMDDRVGSGGITQEFLFVGGVGSQVQSFVIRSPQFNNNGGAVTFVNPTTGIFGPVLNTNSIIGNPGDQTGSGSVFSIGNGRYVVTSPNANGGAGAFEIVNGGGTQGGVVPLNPNAFLFASDPTGTTVIGATDIQNFLQSGAGLILQANTDIVMLEGALISAGDDTSLALQAGRSIFLHGNIKVGGLTLIANDPTADQANRDAGSGDIVLQALNGPVKIDADKLDVQTQHLFLEGGMVDGAFAVLIARGGFKLAAEEVSLVAGTGANADAALISFAGEIDALPLLCNNCTELDFDPTENPATQTGVFELVNNTIGIDAVLALGDPNDAAEGGEDAEGDGEDDDEDDEEDAKMCR